MKLHQSVVTSFFMILERKGETTQTRKKIQLYFFYKPIFSIPVHCTLYQVSRMRLTDF